MFYTQWLTYINICTNQQYSTEFRLYGRIRETLKFRGSDSYNQRSIMLRTWHNDAEVTARRQWRPTTETAIHPHGRIRYSRSSNQYMNGNNAGISRHELLFNNKAVYNYILTTKLFTLELRRLLGVLPLYVMKKANFTFHNHSLQTF